MIKETAQHFEALGHKFIFKTTKLTADSGFYNTANVTHLYEHGIDGYLPDSGFRKRDPRFADVERYRARDKKDKQRYFGRKPQHYTSPDFHYDEATHTCICPAGKKLYSNGRSNNLGGYEALRFGVPSETVCPARIETGASKTPKKTRPGRWPFLLDGQNRRLRVISI